MAEERRPSRAEIDRRAKRRARKLREVRRHLKDYAVQATRRGGRRP